MSISKRDVMHVARLANLELTPEETNRMVVDLNAVLDYASRLESLDEIEADLEDGELTGEARQRPDRVEEWLQPGEATAIAPDSKNDLFRVPPVLGG